MDTDKNSSRENPFLPPDPSSIPAFDKYLVPTGDDYGHEFVTRSIGKSAARALLQRFNIFRSFISGYLSGK